MKQIEKVSIWDNGQTKEAVILNAYAVNVTLCQSATFYYALLSSDKMQLAQGNLTMSGADYQAWDSDYVAWDFIAKELNLIIEGDYTELIPEQDTEQAGEVSVEATVEVNA